MEPTKEVVQTLKQKFDELKEEIHYQLSSNLTEDGKSLIYSIAYWAKRVLFDNEFKYDRCLHEYLYALLYDLPNLLVRYDNLQRILGEIAFFYNPDYKDFF